VTISSDSGDLLISPGNSGVCTDDEDDAGEIVSDGNVSLMTEGEVSGIEVETESSCELGKR
jgi:hypothetical protein